MQWFRLMILAAMAGQLALNGADADRAAAEGSTAVAVAKLPPVLRPTYAYGFVMYIRRRSRYSGKVRSRASPGCHDARRAVRAS